MSVNRMILVGNICRDAEVKTIGESSVANFSVAVSETWKDKQGAKQEKVEYFSCDYWGRGAEAVAPYLTKGRQVYVEGKIQTRKWTGKDGVEKSRQEVRAERVVLLGKPVGDRAAREPGDEADTEPGF